MGLFAGCGCIQQLFVFFLFVDLIPAVVWQKRGYHQRHAVLLGDVLKPSACLACLCACAASVFVFVQPQHDSAAAHAHCNAGRHPQQQTSSVATVACVSCSSVRVCGVCVVFTRAKHSECVWHSSGRLLA